ncbi:MAG: DMT family transporter [Sphingomonadaceae bacterium]|nr:DMT family transporter [Sphingomonadaceae bacterium]
MQRHIAFLPILATLAGIGLFSLMDAFMKSASLAIGAYSALLLRSLIGLALIGPVWAVLAGAWPSGAVLRIHLLRGIVAAFMALTFFFALTRLPLAEAIALSFIAPLVALWLAALLLGEKIRPQAIVAALLGLAGTLVIVGGRIGRERMSDDAAWGLVALFLSALLYAWNLVLQRQQALVALPTEVAAFQNGIVSLILLAGAPWLLVLPDAASWRDVAASAVLSVSAAMVLSWAYRRAEAQVLVPVEYTGFLWAVLFGWLFFAEKVTATTIMGAVLIAVGSWISGRNRPEQSAV